MRWSMVKKLIEDGVTTRVFITPELFGTGLTSEAFFSRRNGLNVTLFVPYRPDWESDLFANYSQVIHKDEHFQVIDIEEFKRVIALIHRT